LRVLVYGGWFGSGNLGDEAILQGVNNVLSKRLPEVELTALSINPEQTYAQTGVKAEKIESPRSFLKNRDRYLDLLKTADIHLLTGGTPFYDYGHLSRIIHFGLPALNNRRVFCFGVGSKPITTLRGREITRIVLKNTAIISTRDDYSKQILQPLTGNRGKPITVTGDSALMLDPVDVKRIGDQVIFCPRRLIEDHKVLYHQRQDQSSINRIRHMQAIAADRLIEKGYHVSFMPFHCVPPDDDREEIRIIRNLMHHEADALPRPDNFKAALKTIGGAALVVGLRLHSIIFASMQGTPFASIDYDIKIRGFMEHMYSRDFLTGTSEGINKLSEIAEKALEDHEKYSVRLVKRVKALRRIITYEADRLAKDINQRKDQRNRTWHPLLDRPSQ
jgi:polysaccharide pyruvyl transferase WcaK-like protein